MPTTTKSNAARRKAPQNAQERPAAQVVQFPLPYTKPRQTAPQEVQVVVCECGPDAVRVRCLPDPAAIVRMMDETFGPLGWTRRYYFADGRLWCGVGVYNPLINNYAVKDAAAPAGKLQISNPDKWKENGSFLAAASLWGAGSDVTALPSMTMGGAPIDPVYQRTAQGHSDQPTGPRQRGRLPVVYNPQSHRIEVENTAKFVETQIFQRLDDLAHGQPLRLTLTVEPEHRGRTTAQNSLMWALRTIMADHYNAGRTGGVTPEDCYLEMLEKYGAKVDYLECPAGALDILRGCYRLVHVVEILDGNRCTVKCTQGSSTFTTGEMKNLIDGIFDRLAEMGVNDPIVTAYWQEWKEP